MKICRYAIAMGFLLAVVAGEATAQASAKVYRVGLLLPREATLSGSPFVDALTRGLVQRGYALGRNFTYEPRGAENHLERLPQLVDELVASKVDVIVTVSYPAALAAKRRSAGIPVVVYASGDPVSSGLVESLARPGGNITGISDVAAELAPKRLQLLKDVTPRLRRVAMLWNAGDLGMTLRYEASAAAARTLGVVVQPFGVREPEDFGDAFAAMTRDPPDAILMVADPLTTLNRKRVFEYAESHRLPAIYEAEPNVVDGGLMSYGPDAGESFERAASLIDRIFKGTRPAELPFEQPTRFRLAINLKAARALGIKIPQSVLVQADRVIE
jgi:putative ABC transport system substrate-binding protein